MDMMAAGLFANAFPCEPARLLFLQEIDTRRYSRRRGEGGNPGIEQVSFNRATTCFACFIRLRSGIANSLQNEPPARSWAPICAEVPCDYGNRMVDPRSRPQSARDSPR